MGGLGVWNLLLSIAASSSLTVPSEGRASGFKDFKRYVQQGRNITLE
jgi:hypothetical protein